MKRYEPKPDPDLRQDYCAGNDEVPFFWVNYRYHPDLFVVVKRRARDRAETADVLSNVVEELCRTDQEKRGQKIKIINEQAKVSLIRLSLSRAIDLFRKNSRFELPADEQDFLLIEDEQSFARKLENRDILDRISQRILQKYGEEAVALFNLIRAYPRELTPLAEALGVSKEEARKRKFSLIRQVRRLGTNLN